jgi:hypothetical protein
MSCSYFKVKNDIGVCSASLEAHIPGIDEMSGLCFKDAHCSCSIFRDCIAEINLRVIARGIGVLFAVPQHRSASKH